METYKAGQGSLTRLAVWVGMIIVSFLASLELYSWIQTKGHDSALINLAVFNDLPLLGVPLSWKFLLCVCVFAGFVWLVRRYMFRKKTVDTLVEVEMEMKKVSWPTREEAMNATWIVVFVTIMIMGVLAAFDVALSKIFELFFDTSARS